MTTRTNSITNTDGTGGPTLPNGLTIGTAHMPAVVGTAPIYACRAWVNFNGTGTVAIRASGNVSSITDNGVGDYTVNFTNAMPDVNYSVAVSGAAGSGNNFAAYESTSTTRTASLVRVFTHGAGAGVDVTQVNVAVFR